MTTEPKNNEPEPKEPEGGNIPEWGKKLQEAVQELAESLKAQPQEPQTTIPVPAEPNHQEPEPIIEPEPEPEPEPKQNPLKSLMAWLM